MKKQIALNKLFNACIIAGVVCGIGTYLLALEGALWFGIIFAVLALALVIGGMVFTPACYLFDEEGVSFCYVFRSNERYLWTNIHSIKEVDISTGKASAIDLLYASVFKIDGHVEGKERPYMKGHMRKSFRTKYLLKKYWDGRIEGGFFDDIIEWARKRRMKKTGEVKEYLTDEVGHMEYNVRLKAEEWLKPFCAQAEQFGLELRPEYLYVTDDFEEYENRPDAEYTYVVRVEIARPNETDEDRMLYLWADLLYVRLGKEAYRGVENKKASKKFGLEFSEMFKEIKEMGFEEYYATLE